MYVIWLVESLWHARVFWESNIRRVMKCTLQHTATHCNTLRHNATHCNTLQHTAPRSLLSVKCLMCDGMHTATHCNTMQHTSTHCKDYTTQCFERQKFDVWWNAHCNTLQHNATLCGTNQHTATHFNTLHHAVFWALNVCCVVECTLQHSATHCGTLHHIASHYNTPSFHSHMFDVWWN